VSVISCHSYQATLSNNSMTNSLTSQHSFIHSFIHQSSSLRVSDSWWLLSNTMSPVVSINSIVFSYKLLFPWPLVNDIKPLSFRLPFILSAFQHSSCKLTRTSTHPVYKVLQLQRCNCSHQLLFKTEFYNWQS